MTYQVAAAVRAAAQHFADTQHRVYISCSVCSTHMCLQQHGQTQTKPCLFCHFSLRLSEKCAQYFFGKRHTSVGNRLLLKKINRKRRYLKRNSSQSATHCKAQEQTRSNCPRRYSMTGLVQLKGPLAVVFSCSRLGEGEARSLGEGPLGHLT